MTREHKLKIMPGTGPAYRTVTARDFRKLPQLQGFPRERLRAMELVAKVLPFKSNNYVVEKLIDWDNPLEDPIFHLTFPQPSMLRPEHLSQVRDAAASHDAERLRETVHRIRVELNPHPAGQIHKNVPRLRDGTRLTGMQHKYAETVLFFPSQGQTCHAYCTFCFRWPQFVHLDGLKFAMREADLLVRYLREHPEVTDVLFTGGDPMIMRAKVLRTYLEALAEADLPHVRTIRIGTKAISYWPYRFISDEDTPELMAALRGVIDHGRHLAIMAHVNHPKELGTPEAEEAVANLRALGAEIRTQSPLMRRINDSPEIWAEMWRRQVNLGMVPYYMFVARDTGAQHYFAVPLVRAWEIYSAAARQVSGLARTVRGPSMSCTPGKVEVTGVAHVYGRKVLALRMLQGRNPEWAYRPFFAEYDETAIWLDDLRPAFGEPRFFFEEEETGLGGGEDPAVAVA
ncbi:MAG: lysine 2,3-aminomutase [Verrucomicrobia bacterium]|nr:MAG: lysine 2,3-aminomutase [Verrucomicrobiota bacterium]